MDGEVALAGLERHALRHRPGEKDAVALEPEVVVEPARASWRWTTKIGLFARFFRPPNGSGVFFWSRLRS